MNIKDEMDGIYRDTPLNDIPWVQQEPPGVLVELVESEAVVPCPAADLGCGAGSYAVWLARKGFQVAGYDCSAEAVRHAEALALERGVSCRFEVADLTQPIDCPDPLYDFVYHWGVLHHVFPLKRAAFAENVQRMLKPDGKHLCMCFSESDAGFESREKFRVTPLGTTLYFSSEQEIRELFETRFRILDLYTTEILGKHRPHQAIVAWMEKR